MVMGGLALWVTYLFGARAFSRRAGVSRRCSSGCMPRVFYHAHLACFDVPIMAMWIALHLRLLARDPGGRPRLGARSRASSTGSRSRRSTTRGSCRRCSCRTRSSSRASDRARRCRAGGCRSRRACSRWRPSGRSSSAALWPWMWNDTLPRISGVRELPREPRVLQHRVPRTELLRAAVAAVVHAGDDRRDGADDHARALRASARSIGCAALVRRFVPLRAASRQAARRAEQPRDRAETDLLLFLAFCGAARRLLPARRRRSSAARSTGCPRIRSSRSSRGAASIVVGDEDASRAARRIATDDAAHGAWAALWSRSSRFRRCDRHAALASVRALDLRARSSAAPRAARTSA